MSVYLERAKVILSRLREPRLFLIAAGASLGLLLVLSGVAFGVDEALHSGKVARNVQVGGREASGLSKEKLAPIVDEVGRRYATTEVKISVDGGTNFETNAGEIGLRVDPAGTAVKALETGRSGSLPSRWMSWMLGFAHERRSALALSVDRAALDKLVTARGQSGDKPPQEARIAIGKSGKFIGMAGRAGEGVNGEELAKELPAAAAKGTPIRVSAQRGDIKPRFNQKDADDAATRAEAIVAKNLPLVVDKTTASLNAAAMRPLISSTPGSDRLELVVDEKKAADAVAAALGAAGTPPKEPTFAIDASGKPVLVPGAPGKVCCGPEAGAKTAAALLNRTDAPLQLDLADRPPKTTNDQALGFGIKEVVSTFTTPHPARQPRVKNIHLIADTIRGQVIPPGESFSINAFVGKRTVEKGYVVDHAIADGAFVEDVGGGVSQFATTLFNAGWFAGMEFPEYQSHSLYISRYPKGRDATLGFPHPDLIVKNPSPYGVLIWPSYTGTSLTVTLYSTHWVDVEALPQDVVQSGVSCQVFTAKRRRKFLDGRVVDDSTRAMYHAAENQTCDQTQPTPSSTSSTAPKPGATTTTTKPGATTTTTTKPGTTTSKPK